MAQVIYGPNVFPVLQSTVYKHWRKLEALTVLGGLNSSFFIYCCISDGVYRFMPLLLHDRQKMIGDAFTLNWWTVCLVMNLDMCVGNRRLDEWVPLGRFESLEKYGVDTYHSGLHSTVGLDLVHGGDRKITRNQKRKHDAINHVQMVCFNCWST